MKTKAKCLRVKAMTLLHQGCKKKHLFLSEKQPVISQEEESEC